MQHPSINELRCKKPCSPTKLKHLSLWLVLLVSLTGLQSQAQVSFDPANFTFEAEDFNFEGGSFFDNPTLCDSIGGGPNCYFDRVGFTNIDQHEINFEVTVAIPLTNEVYRWGGITAPLREEWVDTFSTGDSLIRTQYSNANLPDWEVRSIAVGEWLNYSRTYPAGNYNIYMRASSGSALAADMHKVDNATTTSQNLTYLGRFATTAATSGYEFVPLTDFTGTNEIVVAFPGGVAQTLRVTARSPGFIPNFYMFVSSTNAANLPPLVQITNPTEGAALTEGVTVSIQATATDSETAVTNVQFYAGTEEPLTLIGETNVGPYHIDWTPPLLGSIRIYTLRVVATDSTGLAGSDEIQVEVSDPDIEFVSTAIGNGADAEMREGTDLGVSNGGNYNSIRARTGSGNNEIIALRFDLTGNALAALTDVQLNLTSMRDDTSNRQLALYGVTAGSTGATGSFTTEDWDETGLLEFGYMPGLLATDGVMLTQSLDTNKVTALGLTGGPAVKGEVKTFSGTALTDFVRSISGSSQVTFLVAFSPSYTSTGQARFASKEADSLDGGTPLGAVGDFAPFLQFKVLSNAPPFVTITNPADSAELESGVEINIAVDASDGDGTVTNVDFYAGTSEPLALLGSDNSAPYSLPWTPVATEPVTLFTVRAVATDNVGQSSEDSIDVSVLQAAVEIVSTAVGGGADVEMREPNDPSAARGSNGDLNTRWNINSDTPNRNEVVGLKFDLTGYTNAEINDVMLNLINYRDNSSRIIDVYGVTQGAAGGTGAYTTETWQDTTVTAWGDLPGLLVADGSVLTASIDTNNLTLLVDDFTITSLTEGTPETVSSPTLTSFVQDYTGSSLITFLITQGGGGSGGQFRFASREAAALTTISGAQGDFAPYLSFTVGVVAPPTLDYTVAPDGASVDFSWTGTFKLQSQTNTLSTGLSTNWLDYPGGASSPVSVPIDQAQGSVFFRLGQ